jgi:hypothetical protein
VTAENFLLLRSEFSVRKTARLPLVSITWELSIRRSAIRNSE